MRQTIFTLLVWACVTIPAAQSARADDDDRKRFNPKNFFERDKDKDRDRDRDADRRDTREGRPLDMRATVNDLDRVSGGSGEQARVWLRVTDDDGRDRTVHFGALGEHAPRITDGSEVKMLGRVERIGNHEYFRVAELRAADDEFRTGDRSRREYETVRGRLEGFWWLSQRDGSVEGASLRIVGEDGRRYRALFGPAAEPRGEDLIRPGSRIEFAGGHRNIGDQRVFVAQNVRVVSARPARAEGEQVFGVERNREVVKGRVVKIDRIASDSEVRGSVEHPLVRLTFEGGKSELVDLGPRFKPSRVGLDEGDRVELEGFITEMHGRKFLSVEHMQVDGQWIKLR